MTWVFIDAPNGNDKEEPDWFKERRGYTDDDCPGELYNVKDDLSERYNEYAEHPDLVEEMSQELEHIKESHGGPGLKPGEKVSE